MLLANDRILFPWIVWHTSISSFECSRLLSNIGHLLPDRPSLSQLQYVRLQAIIFLSATAGFSAALFIYLKVYLPSRAQWNVPTQQEAATRYVAPVPPPEPAPETDIQRIIKRLDDWKKMVLGCLPNYLAGQERELTLLPRITIP